MQNTGSSWRSSEKLKKQHSKMADVLDLQGEAGEFEEEVEDDERTYFLI